VTIFEKDNWPGGLSSTEIPSYRLPYEVLSSRPPSSLSLSLSNSFSLYSVHPREKPLTTVQVVEFEISLMKDLGVKIEYGKELGRDFTVESLRKDGYEAVFLGIGMPKVATWLA
jgi:dihydropyrimidine dehydrogenase (NADP+)